MVIFRDEALKLYNKLDEKTQENEVLRSKLKELEKHQQIIDFQEKEKIKTLKVEEMSKITLEGQVQELEQIVNLKEQEITRLSKKIEEMGYESQRKSII